MGRDNKLSTEYWFIFQNNKLVLTRNNELLSSALISEMRMDFIKQFCIGDFENIVCYSSELSEATPLPDHVHSLPLRKALDLLDKRWYTPAARAASILNWDMTHQFCGRCGHPTISKSNTLEKQCTNCDLVFYPRISPSIIVLIHRGEEILMARGPHFTPGAYGLIAGFVEAGESLEETIHRETREEVNISIKNIRYFDSQAWPFPDSLMIGFIAEYESGNLKIDENEIEAAGWYHYSELPGRPSSKASISNRLIDYFIAQQTQKRNET